MSWGSAVPEMVAAVPQAFTAIEIVGGLYLIWLGVGAVRSHALVGGSSPMTPGSPGTSS